MSEWKTVVRVNGDRVEGSTKLMRNRENEGDGMNHEWRMVRGWRGGGGGMWRVMHRRAWGR